MMTPIKRYRYGLLLGVTVALGGCAALHSNVKGNFACAAPVGTCAPTTKIDEQAMTEIGADALLQPAGPYRKDDDGAVQTTAQGLPLRSGEKILRIVFPAHSENGRYYETSAVHIVVAHGGWVANGDRAPAAPDLSLTNPLAPVAMPVPPPATLTTDATPSLTELASSAPEFGFPAPTSAAQTLAPAPSVASATQQPAITPLSHTRRKSWRGQHYGRGHQNGSSAPPARASDQAAQITAATPAQTTRSAPITPSQIKAVVDAKLAAYRQAHAGQLPARATSPVSGPATHATLGSTSTAAPIVLHPSAFPASSLTGAQ